MSRISFVPTSEWSEELRTFVAADSATELELGITRISPTHRKHGVGFGGAMATKRTLPERQSHSDNQCWSRMAILPRGR